MSSLTTLFNVGAEEYVEFNESLGSKAFLEHVWDQETTPLKQGETADSRLRSAGARLSSSDPPCIEFPTISRIKGKGNEYRLTGRWISWQDLQCRHPLAVRDPPDIAEFQRRGAKVGAGEKLNPGEWLTEESLSSKAAKHGKKETRENDGWIARGSSQSKYAPKPVAAASSSPQVERNGIAAATPLLPQSNGFAAPSSSSSLLGRFTTPAEDEEEKVGGSGDDVDKPGPRSPKTPARTRPAGLQLDLESTPTHMRPFTLPLVSPSTTRTPLSATHPLPETPLKHTSALPVAQPNSARQALAERRSRPSVPPLSPPSRDAEEEAMRGLGLGLGLTPTRPTAYVGLGAALSPVQQRRMDLPTIPSSNDEGDEGGASSHETVKATSHPPVVAAHRDDAVDEIESMLLRLRKAKSGLASAAGSSASRWASPAATTAPLAAPPEHSAVRDSQDEIKARKASGEERPQQQKASAESEVAVNGKAGPAAGEGRKERKTKKEKKDKATKGAAPSASSSTAASTSAAAAPPPPTPHLSGDDGGWGAPKRAAAQHPPTPTAPRAMRQKPEERRPDTRARAGKEAAPSAPSSEPSVPVEQPPKLASPPAISSAPRQPTPPPLAEPSPPPRPATPPPPPANDAGQPPQTPAMPSSATATSLASPLLASPSPSTPSHRDLDWAADDDDDEDALPDLGDWGVVLPPSGSTSSVGGGAADMATPAQPQAKAAPARAQPKAAAPAAQRELFPAGGPASAKGPRGGQARAVSAAQAAQPSASASSSEYAAWRRGERASSAKPAAAALPASSSRELFPSSPASNSTNTAGAPAWPRHQQHAAQAAPSPADGDWKAARTATLAAEEKREKKVAAAAGAKSKGKAATHGAAQPAAKRAPSSAAPPPAAQGIKIAGVAKAGAGAPPDKAVVAPTAVSPPKGPKADRVVSKKGGGGGAGKSKKEAAAAASANGGGDGVSKHKPRA